MEERYSVTGSTHPWLVFPDRVPPRGPLEASDLLGFRFIFDREYDSDLIVRYLRQNESHQRASERVTHVKYGCETGARRGTPGRWGKIVRADVCPTDAGWNLFNLIVRLIS